MIAGQAAQQGIEFAQKNPKTTATIMIVAFLVPIVFIISIILIIVYVIKPATSHKVKSKKKSLVHGGGKAVDYLGSVLHL